MKNKKYSVFISLLTFLCLSLSFSSCGAKNTELTSASGVETTTSAPEIVPESTVTIGAAGDLLMHRPIYENAKKEDGTYDFSSVFTHTENIIKDCDYFIANLETTFGGTSGRSYSSYPRFNTPDELADTLVKSGIDCVLTANNHSYDTDGDGFLRTIETVKKAGLDYTGTRASQDEKQYFIKDIGGINFGFICYTYETPATGYPKALNGIPLDEKTAPLVNSFDPASPEAFYSELKANIEKMKAEDADVIAVFTHWGNEYQLTPNEVQQDIAQNICNLGADVIIGGHPHVVQSVDLLTAKDNSHKTVCVYSLGNFVSNQRRNLMGIKTGHTEDGIIFTMTFTKYSDGTVTPDSIEIIPTWVHMYIENGKYIHAIVPLYGDLDASAESKGLMKSSDGLALAKGSLERTRALTEEGEKKCNDWLKSKSSSDSNTYG